MLSDSQIKKIQSVMESCPFIKTAWVFGSCARGEDTVQSDVDIMYDNVPGVRYGLFALMNIKSRLEQAIEKDVDLVLVSSMLPEVYESAQNDKRIIYEKN